LGAQITDVLGAQAPPELLGIHSNMPGTVPPEVSRALASGGPAPAGLSADERRAFEQLRFLYTKGIGYATEMGLRPQTLYGLADSPVALAAWMLDHDAPSYQDIAAAFAGDPVGNLTREEVLDNITRTWVTNTGVSSARLYWENTLGFFDVKGVTVPAAVSVFLGTSIRRRGAGPSGPTPTSSTQPGRPGQPTSRPGRSRACSRPRCEPRSGPCADRRRHQQRRLS